MKKIISLVTLIGFLTLTFTPAIAQTEGDSNVASTEAAAAVDSMEDAVVTTEPVESETKKEEVKVDPASEDEGGLVNRLRAKFIEGGVEWMTPVLLCLIIGLALCIERIITLNLSTTNTKKLLTSIDTALKAGNIEEAKEVCKSTRGPIAGILHQGLDRTKEGIEIVEKSIISYGSVQMGLLEKGLVWISLFIALAPMLGFLGTVIGMIAAFASIEAAGDISATVVASGIKVALLTTAFGLIVAVILQIFYNYIVAKVDSIVNNMEEASITFIDMLIKRGTVNPKND